MIFPLPLTPFEEYMVRDGTPSHPMEFFFRLSFDGPLDEDACAVAAAEAFRRHPLLAARIDDSPGRGPRFEPGTTAPAVRTLAADGTDGLPAVPALDPHTGPLGRLYLVARADDTREILAQFHHAACDGLGALAFLADVCGILDATVHGRRPTSVPPDARPLRDRGRYGLDGWKLLRALPAQSRGLEGVWKFARHRPVRMAIEARADGPPNVHHLQRQQAVFSLDEGRGLRAAANAAGVSLNELAAAALFRAVREQLPPSAFRHPRDVVRLSIPMNMRRPADRRLPAANVVSMVFLDRNPASIEAAGLAASLHDEMQLIKRLGLGMTFLFTLATARWLPGGISRFVGDRSTAATALFTNLGRILSQAAETRGGHVRVGSLRLVDVEVLAPLRRGTSLAVAASEYGGMLSFTLRTDPSLLDTAATTAIRDAFDRQLRRHLQGLAQRSPSGPARAVVEPCA